MKLKRKVRISQCMIVKNEESNITQALSWGKSIMWEQIVVDTGSTDRTIELAEKMGAKVYRFDWTNDFAAAKNYAISQASGDWIAFLDADEYVREEETTQIARFISGIQNSPYLALTTELLNLDDNGRVFSRSRHMRFFRNLTGLCYEGRIHENLTMDGNLLKAGELKDTGDAFYIYHTGYRESVMEDGEKSRRDRQIIESELENRPGSWELMGYLGDCYRVEKDYARAIEWYEKAMEVFCGARDNIQDDPQMERIFSFLMLLLAAEGREKRLREVYEMALALQPVEPDYDFIIGKYYACKGLSEKGICHLERALELMDQCGQTLRGSLLAGGLQEAMELLAICCRRRGEDNKCVGYCTNYLKADPYGMSVLALLLTVFKEEEERCRQNRVHEIATEGGRAADAAEVVMFLGRLYDFNSLKDRIFVLRAATEIGYTDLVKVIRGTFSPEEWRALEQAMGR